MNLIISGISGKMGKYVYELARNTDGVNVVCGVDKYDAGIFSCPVYPTFDEVVETADVVIDFSRPDLLGGVLSYAMRVGAGVVLATTGYTKQDLDAIDKATKKAIESGLTIRISGSFNGGYVVSQSLPIGAVVKRGKVIHLYTMVTDFED